MARRVRRLWYAVKVEDGKEGSVKRAVMRNARIKDLEGFFGGILIPRVRRVVLKNGKRTTVVEEKYPGYVLVRMHVNEDTYHLVRDCRYVFGFVEMDVYGTINEDEDTTVRAPVPIDHDEALWLVMQDQLARKEMKDKASKVCPFKVGDKVVVTEGTYKDKLVEVEELVSGDEAKVRIKVHILGIPLDVFVPCWQVRRAKKSEL